MAKVRVLVADEETLFREGVCALLRRCKDIEVVGEATTVRETIEKAQQYTPDVVLTNIIMPFWESTEVVRQIRKDNNNIKILILGEHKEKQHILRALKAGSNGYILKSATLSELMSAILAVHTNGCFLYSPIVKMLVNEYLRIKQDTNNDPYDKLTDREKEVLPLLAGGLKYREIATQLHIAVKTVQGFTVNIRRKLGVHNRTGLIKYAIRKHLVEMEG